MDKIAKIIEELVNGAYNAGHNSHTDSVANARLARKWIKSQQKRLIKMIERHLSEASTRPDDAGDSDSFDRQFKNGEPKPFLFT